MMTDSAGEVVLARARQADTRIQRRLRATRVGGPIGACLHVGILLRVALRRLVGICRLVGVRRTFPTPAPIIVVS